MIEASENPSGLWQTLPTASTSQGLIDEVRVYNRALTQTDIQADMNSPVPGS